MPRENEVVVVCPAGEHPCIYINEVRVLHALATGPVGPGGYQHNKEAHNEVFESVWHGLSKALGGGQVILHVAAGDDIIETIRANRQFRIDEEVRLGRYR